VGSIQDDLTIDNAIKNAPSLPIDFNQIPMKPKINLYQDIKSLTLLIPVYHPAPYLEKFQNLINIKSNSNESLYIHSIRTIIINTHNFQILNEFISTRAPSLNVLII